jgi:hypothetical protein
MILADEIRNVGQAEMFDYPSLTVYVGHHCVDLVSNAKLTERDVSIKGSFFRREKGPSLILSVIKADY